MRLKGRAVRLVVAAGVLLTAAVPLLGHAENAAAAESLSERVHPGTNQDFTAS